MLELAEMDRRRRASVDIPRGRRDDDVGRGHADIEVPGLNAWRGEIELQLAVRLDDVHRRLPDHLALRAQPIVHGPAQLTAPFPEQLVCPAGDLLLHPVPILED
jgi:hypothetical protein